MDVEWPFQRSGPRRGQDCGKPLSFSGELYIGHGPPWLCAVTLCRPALHLPPHTPANREDVKPQLLPAAERHLGSHRLHSQEAEGHFWDARSRDCPGFHVLPSTQGPPITFHPPGAPALDRGHQHLSPDTGGTTLCPCHGWDPSSPSTVSSVSWTRKLTVWLLEPLWGSQALPDLGPGSVESLLLGVGASRPDDSCCLFLVFTLPDTPKHILCSLPTPCQV